MNLSTWTLIVLGISIGYFLITTVIGFLGARRTKQGLHEFYVAGGTLSAVTVMFTYMAAYMEAWEFVGMPAVIVSEGFEWWVIETIFYLSYVGLFFAIGLRLYRLGKKFGFITPTDLIIHRVGGFERPLRILIALMIFYATIIYIGMIYIPAAGVLSAATGGEIPYHMFLLIYVIFVIIYVSAGGMRAVAYADILAGVAFIVGFISMVYGAFVHWGGVDKLAWSAYMSELGPQIFQKTQPLQYFLTMYLFYGISWLFIPHLTVKFFAAKNYKGVIIGGMGSIAGFFLGAFVSPLLIGLSLAAYYGGNLPQVEVVEGLVPLLFEALFGRGLVLVLILIGLIAITRSTIDAMLLLCSSLIDVDIIEKGIGVKISANKRRLVTTLIVVFVALVSMIIALNPEAPMVILGYQLCWPAYSIIAWPTIVLILWPRANKYGGFASYLAGFASLLLFTYVVWPEPPHNPFGIWEGALPTLISLIALIVVSLLTSPPSRYFVEKYYGQTRQ
ncbi:MAG: sodium:solute symporter family protein [Thermosphaera sp.]